MGLKLKKMKTQLIKSIFFYLLTSIFYLLKANAQIVYTNVNPDATSSGGYNLDLNNDGITDFIITHTTSTISGSPNCSGTKTNNFIKVSPTGNNQCATNKLVANTIINSSLLTWNSSANQVIASSIWHCGFHPNGWSWTASYPGHWSNSVIGYMALKITVNGNTYYGWLGMNTFLASTFTIKDYAYNSIPNQPILAGEISCTTPTVNLTQSGPLSFCAGDSVTLTANGTGYQYQWKKNNVNIAGATNKTYAAKTAGVYKCKVTNSCGSKTSGTRTVTVPCRESTSTFVEALEYLSVYPNPATNSVTIKFPSDEPGEIQVVNLFGQIVFSEKINTEQAQIDVSKFSEGMYIVKWTSGENFETKTFAVTK